MSSTIHSPTERLLTPPPGAAISGVVFAVLAIVGLGLVRYAIPADVRSPGNWLTEPHHRNAVRLALDLVPFAGIAFLWFIGVLRNLLGELEDQFFATLFLGSGLLFVVNIFVSAAFTTALVESVAIGKAGGETYFFGRAVSDALLNVFAMRMAGVFMFSICTIGIRTGIFPRWVALVGYACALLLVIVIADWKWITLIFPIWMLLLSTQIFLAQSRDRSTALAGPPR